MEFYRNVFFIVIGIFIKFFFQNFEVKGVIGYFYCVVVQEFGLLVLESCFQKKLECIVWILWVICVCVEDYCFMLEVIFQVGFQFIVVVVIGVDDLLFILFFVVLRSGFFQLVLECVVLEEFIYEGYLIGEEGYCLILLQSVLSYVELLFQGGLVKQQSQILGFLQGLVLFFRVIFFVFRVMGFIEDYFGVLCCFVYSGGLFIVVYFLVFVFFLFYLILEFGVGIFVLIEWG